MDNYPDGTWDGDPRAPWNTTAKDYCDEDWDEADGWEYEPTTRERREERRRKLRDVMAKARGEELR